MRIQKHFPLVVFLAATASLLGRWEAGQALPDLAGFELVGDSAPELEGKVVLIDFWASWCGPCRHSFPLMEALREEYASDDFEILAISVDGTEGNYERFRKRLDPSFTTLWDSQQQLVATAGIQAMPTSFLVDRSGTIRFAHQGFHKGETDQQLRSEIQSLLASAQ